MFCWTAGHSTRPSYVDMDLTRFAVDAGQFINRAVQYTGESLGRADKTELDTGLEELLTRADATKTWTDKIISQTEALLQPNPGARLEDRLYEQLDWSISPRPRAHELLGDQMTQAGLEIGSNTPYGIALLRCGEVQKQLGKAEGKFIQSTNIHFLTPLRSFTEGEYRAIEDERRMLLNKRLDLDIAKTRLKKAHEADQEARDLDANPVRDDYVSHASYMFSFLRVKWLKIWAQEISQAEMELRICQTLFDRQSENTRLVLEGIRSTHINHMRSLTDLVEAQACYFDQCYQHTQELQKQLASIPAVLCSNNWQSAIHNTINQPPTSNNVATEPVAVNQSTPNPIVVHHLPDFDQDTWTTNPPIGNENTTRCSLTTTQPPNQTNNNNNNNVSTGSQAARFHRAIKRQSSFNQPFDFVCTSDSDRHLTDQLSAPNGMVATCVTTNRTTADPQSSQTVNAVASVAITTSDMAVEPQTSNETGSTHLTANEEDFQVSASGNQD
ncbi:Endophilin-B1 SH3 domain-containing GRB2-like protein B1 [Channa argus]|uniref:Endophilin-B1 SH3 domain-containing GRB2-like protein B1 n=1 Tax=Channa argus TaxID=215402 RepID=A0A6G1QEA6_CHAAH|nr:Endophilin-B1 SH3 domain-containing GRB2-like protein B1 [Channa argus]